MEKIYLITFLDRGRYMIKIIKKTLFIIYLFFSWLLLQPFCWFFYDRKYLRGRWFKKWIFSEGWEWCKRDIVHRIFYGQNISLKFPCSPYITCTPDIEFHTDDLNNLNGFGNYFQAFNGGKIIIGKGTWIAKNVGIITVNHDIYNPDLHQEPKNVILGESCWVGMNAMILPGVVLGPHTVVGAGSVVTKSFPDGYCVIAGNPAKKIKDLKLYIKE